MRYSRDLTELRALAGLPVLAVGFDPRPASQIGVDWNVPVRVFPFIREHKSIQKAIEIFNRI